MGCPLPQPPPAPLKHGPSTSLKYKAPFKETIPRKKSKYLKYYLLLVCVSLNCKTTLEYKDRL